jgi:hypothetical protein
MLEVKRNLLTMIIISGHMMDSSQIRKDTAVQPMRSMPTREKSTIRLAPIFWLTPGKIEDMQGRL